MARIAKDVFAESERWNGFQGLVVFHLGEQNKFGGCLLIYIRYAPEYSELDITLITNC